jgi:hypothetical protein
MDVIAPYVAISYHFRTDRHFVADLALAMRAADVPVWYLDELAEPADISTMQLFGGQYDWRRLPRAWHATFLEQLLGANGVLTDNRTWHVAREGGCGVHSA